jgi:hypothetical protein
LRGWRGEEGVRWVVSEGGEEMTQALYAHMNNKKKEKEKTSTKKKKTFHKYLSKTHSLKCIQ